MATLEDVVGAGCLDLQGDREMVRLALAVRVAAVAPEQDANLAEWLDSTVTP